MDLIFLLFYWTCVFQIHGFTCGLDDLIVLPHYDIRRKEELEGEDVGESVHCDFVHFQAGKIGMHLRYSFYLKS